MIFLIAESQPILHLCLISEDATKLRSGLTLYVEPQMTGGRFFNEIVLSLHKTKEEILAMLRTAQPGVKIPAHLPEPPPREGEMKCKSCDGSNTPGSLYDGRCIVCWATEAKRFRTANN